MNQGQLLHYPTMGDRKDGDGKALPATQDEKNYYMDVLLERYREMFTICEDWPKEKMERKQALDAAKFNENLLMCRNETKEKKKKSIKITIFPPPKPTDAWKTERNVRIQWMIKVKAMANMLAQKGKSGARFHWLNHCRDLFQRLCASHLSSATGDKSLINGLMLLRKLDLLELEVLSDGSWETLRRVQNVLLYTGYNFWTTAAAKLMSFCHTLKNTWDSLVPVEASIMSAAEGVGRKILMLMFQDGLNKPLGIVGDRHVGRVFFHWSTRKKYTLAKYVKSKTAVCEEVCRDIESWMPCQHWRDMNEVIAGLRQLCALKKERAQVLDLVKGMGHVQVELMKQVLVGIDEDDDTVTITQSDVSNHNEYDKMEEKMAAATALTALNSRSIINVQDELAKHRAEAI